MNDDLSNIIEQALQYASPLPVSEPTVSIEKDLPEPEECLKSSFINEDTDASMIHELCDFNVNNNTEENTGFIEILQSSGTAVHDVRSSHSPILFPEYTFPDNCHGNQSDMLHTLGCEEEIIESPSIDNCDREFVNTELVSDGTNFTRIQPVTAVTEIQPDYSSGLINEIHDITDACLRFENEHSGISTATVESTENNETDGVKPKIKRRRRREKNPGPPPEPVLPPCSICEAKSSGYHYGANTCEACKGFYRRTLKKKEVDYKCRCTPEEKEAWKRGPFNNGCPACRYEKCLAVGMSKNAIKIGRYTLNHKTKNINKVKSVEAVDSLITALTQATSEGSPTSTSGLDDISTSSSTVDLTELSIGMPSTSNEDPPCKMTKISSSHLQEKPTISLKEIDSLVKILTDAHTSLQLDDRDQIPTETIRKKQDEYLEKFKLKRELFGTMRQLTKDEFTEFYNATGIDIDGRIEHVDKAFKFFEEKITMVVAFAKAIPGFKKLGLDDQANLIKASRVESTLICTYKNMQRNFDKEKRVITTPWGMYLHLDEMERIVPRDLMMAHYDQSKQLLQLNLSVQEESILRAILVVFSDRCKLDEPKKVEAIQEKLITCLQHLVHLRPGGAGTSLYKIFSVITNMRNLSDIALDFQKGFLVNWPMFSVSNYHLLREFLT